MKITKSMRIKAIIVSALLAGGIGLAYAAEDSFQSVTGEVVDMMCYLDHGAKGDKHAGCAKGCISKGGPVGILTKDDQLYLVIGDHKPANDMLAPYAGKSITVKGKVVERNGVKMIQHIEIDKKAESS